MNFAFDLDLKSPARARRMRHGIAGRPGRAAGNSHPDIRGGASLAGVGTFMPGDPCISAGVRRAGGPPVAYGGTPVQVGSWDVSIQAAAVPEPASAPLGLFGLAALALAQRRALRRI